MADTKDLGDRIRGALCRILEEGAAVHRSLAAKALGRIAGRGATEALVAALLDEDEDVRSDAAAALARLADPRAGERLMESLIGDPCADVKLEAMEGLVRLRHPGIAALLRRLLKGRDDAIAWDDAAFYAEGWDDWTDIEVKAVEGLGALGVREAVPDIVAAIEDEFGQDLTETGFKVLARLGGPGIDALATFLGSGDERRRRRAAAALAASDAPAAHDPVTRALRDPAPDVRLAAARALAARCPADERLASLFGDASDAVRAAAVGLCGHRHPDGMERLLDDDAPLVRRAALEALAETPDLLSPARVAERARSDVCGPDPELAATAARLLARAEPDAARPVLIDLLTDPHRPPEARLGAARGLAEIGGDGAVRGLVEVLADDRRQVRLHAMTALATLADSRGDASGAARDALLAALGGDLVRPPEGEPGDAPGDVKEGDDAHDGPDEGPDERPDEGATETSTGYPTSTLEAIAGEGAGALAAPDESPIELTAEDLEHLALAERTPRNRYATVETRVAPHEDVRRFAARLLGDVARDEVAEALAAHLSGGDAEVRMNAADSLARLAERLDGLPEIAVEALLEAAEGTLRDLRLAAVRALGAGGGEKAVPVLVRRLDDDDSFVRTEAIRALSELGGKAPEIEARLDDPDPGARLAAARAVARAGGPRAVERLVDFAFEHGGRHRREAARLLRDLDGKAASARFLDVLDDRSRLRTWQVAIEALEELNRPDPADGPGDDLDMASTGGKSR